IGDRPTLQHGKEIVNFANQKRIPSMLDRAYPETASVMMSYGVDEDELWRRAAAVAETPAANRSSDRVACREKRRIGFNRVHDLQPRRSDSIHDAEREMSNAAVIVFFVS